MGSKGFKDVREILSDLEPGHKVPVVKKGGRFFIYGKPRDPNNSHEADFLRKNLVGARMFHGKNAFLFPG